MTLTSDSAQACLLSLAPASAEPEKTTGSLDVTFAVRNERTILSRQHHRGALKVIRPFYLSDGAAAAEATLTVLNPGGGYVGGDVYRQHITLQAGAKAVMTTQSATRVYRTPHSEVTQDTDLIVEDNAVLTYVPDELIGYADARYVQRTRAQLAKTATLFAKDVVTPGWAPDGRLFQYRKLHTIFDVVGMPTPEHHRGKLLARDNLFLAPERFGISPEHTALAETFTHVGSLLIVSPHVDAGTVDVIRDVLSIHEGKHLHLRTGVSRMPINGVLIRALGVNTAVIDGAIGAVIDQLRADWFGWGPLPRRKY
ncbi:urease accessory protein UreD [Dermatophilus congolensis]|uniref:Urease accessory protein UreD n=1 Tax=Dermatophilus congolensis TaxID=1863 RepID=A0A239V7J2_9MICO|nr:urease accessory protein UreD [Dermatophilus congolensis]MBO3200160.1 urease accessory protein UreD [Dermatophilus congolensis]SNV18170.1 Urease accessory protein UreD [Dermatophilus congolensis]